MHDDDLVWQPFGFDHRLNLVKRCVDRCAVQHADVITGPQRWRGDEFRIDGEVYIGLLQVRHHLSQLPVKRTTPDLQVEEKQHALFPCQLDQVLDGRILGSVEVKAVVGGKLLGDLVNQVKSGYDLFLGVDGLIGSHLLLQAVQHLLFIASQGTQSCGKRMSIKRDDLDGLKDRVRRQERRWGRYWCQNR